MAEIVWTETALADIDSIAEYISNDSFYYATQFVEKLLLAANILERYPEIGKPVPELKIHLFRQIIYKNYRIIYRINSTIVYIISVHHSARLLSNNEHFKDLFE